MLCDHLLVPLKLYMHRCSTPHLNITPCSTVCHSCVSLEQTLAGTPGYMPPEVR